MLFDTSLVTLRQPIGRRKRHPELTPVLKPRDNYTNNSTATTGMSSSPSARLPRDTSMTAKKGAGGLFGALTVPASSSVTSTPTTDGHNKVPRRAVSMTRLYQLAQPRRRYLEETLKWRAERLGNSPPTSCMTQSLMVSPGVTCNQKKRQDEDAMVRSVNENLLGLHVRPSSSFTSFCCCCLVFFL